MIVENMMKKIFWIACVLTLALGFDSCKKDSLPTSEKEEKKEEQKKEEEKTTDPQIWELLKQGKKFELSYKYIGNVPRDGDHYVAQGAASDGKSVYFVLRDKDDKEAVIVKYNLDPFKAVAVGPVFNGGHCNDLTFDTLHNWIVLAHGQSQGKTLTILDPGSLKVMYDMTIKVGSGAITYNTSRRKYAISQGGTTLYVADNDLNVEKSYTRTDKTGYTAQGMGSDDNYIYFPMSNGKTDNLLVTYNWEGQHIADLKLGIAKESESMFWVNGKYYVCFYDSDNASKGAALYEVFPKK